MESCACLLMSTAMLICGWFRMCVLLYWGLLIMVGIIPYKFEPTDVSGYSDDDDMIVVSWFNRASKFHRVLGNNGLVRVHEMFTHVQQHWMPVLLWDGRDSRVTDGRWWGNLQCITSKWSALTKMCSTLHWSVHGDILCLPLANRYWLLYNILCCRYYRVAAYQQYWVHKVIPSSVVLAICKEFPAGLKMTDLSNSTVVLFK